MKKENLQPLYKFSDTQLYIYTAESKQLMAKIISLFITTLFLFLALSVVVARSFYDVTPVNEAQSFGIDEEYNSCVGVGDDECMMRRTLQANLDYIYTQNHNKQP